jgi:uncharacterized protein (DUF885 family)
MSNFQALNDAYLEFLALDPNSCVDLGLSVYLDELPDPSLEHLLQTRQLAAELRGKAEALAPTLDDFHQQLDARLIALAAGQVETWIGLSFNDKLQLQQLPQAGSEISSGIFLMVTNDPRPAAQRLQDIAARIQQIPAYLERALARLDTPVARWVDIERETIDGLPDFFASIVAWAESEAFAGLDALRASVQTANDAFAAYSAQLQLLPTTDSFAIGDEQARALVAGKGLELSLEEIHQVARDFVKRTRDDIEALRDKLVTKYELAPGTSASELQQYLAKRYAVQVSDGDHSQVIKRYQTLATQIEAFIAERDLFPIPSGQAMQIMPTPDFMAPLIPAGAMMPPAALREGTRVSLVYLTLSDELLDEHTELGIPIMMVHEGIPGHHLQLATASMHDSVVRRTFSANEHAEGWTTMLEDYMLDQGLMGELVDEARFATKLDISRIGARVAIDLYFMTGNTDYLDIGYPLDFDDEDPFVNAARLLVAATGFTPGRAQAELNWYSQERGYPLSYLVGNHLVWKLKRDYQQACAGNASEQEIDREFHRIYLESGNMPVAMLRRVYEHELQRAL